MSSKKNVTTTNFTGKFFLFIYFLSLSLSLSFSGNKREMYLPVWLCVYIYQQQEKNEKSPDIFNLSSIIDWYRLCVFVFVFVFKEKRSKIKHPNKYLIEKKTQCNTMDDVFLYWFSAVVVCILSERKQSIQWPLSSLSL